MHFVPTDPAHPDAQALISALDADLTARYPRAPVHGIDPSTLVAQGGVLLVGRRDGRPVACGALRPLPDGTVEVKRMFVDPSMRRTGVARALLARLEAIARERGFALVRIETGDRQPEAVALYERAGYARIPPFGEYVGNSFSVCFEKRLEVRG